MMLWMMNGVGPDVLGLLPTFFDEDDPRPAKEQIADPDHYGHWHPMDGFALLRDDGKELKLVYPDDPPLDPLAFATLHGEEMLVLFECEFLAIIQKDGSFEAMRVD